MKKKTAYILGLIGIGLAAVLIFLASYAEKKNAIVNDYEGISMKAQEDSISADGLILDIENTTEDDVTFDDEFIIEKKIYGQWYKMSSQSLAAYSWQDAVIVIPADTSVFSACHMQWLDSYGKLGSGSYRLLKKFKTADGESHTLAVTFSI